MVPDRRTEWTDGRTEEANIISLRLRGGDNELVKQKKHLRKVHKKTRNEVRSQCQGKNDPKCSSQDESTQQIWDSHLK